MWLLKNFKILFNKIQNLKTLTDNDASGCGYWEFLKGYSPIVTFASTVDQLLLLLGSLEMFINKKMFISLLTNKPTCLQKTAIYK